MKRFALVLLLAGCVPTKLSPKCQEQLDECLKMCRPGDQLPAAAQSADTRSPCESNCDSQASQCH